MRASFIMIMLFLCVLSGCQKHLSLSELDHELGKSGFTRIQKTCPADSDLAVAAASGDVFNDNGIPKRLFYIGGGLNFGYKFPWTGTLYIVDENSKCVLLTQYLQGPLETTLTIDPADKEFNKMTKSMPIDISNLKISYYFVPYVPGKKPKGLIDTSSLKMTSKMMEEKQYWNIVQRSLNETKNQDAQEKWLIEELQKLPLEEIIGFRLRTDWLLYHSYNSELWCAGYVINGGCSDDLFEYFRCWVISRGEKAYNNAKQDPDSLIDEVNDKQDLYDFESFWYVALVAFEKKTGKNLYDFVDYDTFATREGNYPKFEFNWQENNPESMKKICPRLCEIFNKK